MKIIIFLNLSKNDFLSDESPCDFERFWKMTRFSLFFSSLFDFSRNFQRKWLFSLKRCLIYLEIMKFKGFFNEKGCFSNSNDYITILDDKGVSYEELRVSIQVEVWKQRLWWFIFNWHFIFLFQKFSRRF